MLPVLWNLIIPAAWAKPAAIFALLLIVGARAWTFRGRIVKEGGKLGWGEALWDDKYSIVALVALLVGLWRAGYLDEDVPLPIHTYGLMIATGFLAAIYLAQTEARRQGQDAERLGDLAFWVLVSSLIGSRVFFIIVNWKDYFLPNTWLVKSKLLASFGLSQIPRVLAITEGGLVFYGGFIFAALTSYFYMRRHKMDFWRHADTAIPGVAIGHFFGRLGCFAAGCCWGDVAHRDLPWLAKFPPESLAYQTFSERPNAAELLTPDKLTTVAVHPTQLYESFGELLLFFALVYLIRPNKKFHGQALASWLMMYAILRTTVELFRGDLERGVYLGLGFGQWVSIAIFTTGVAVWLVNRPRAATATEAPAAA
jgi:phosphatidylglycerol:prolipoprotein diacylglycerol transferase